MAADAVIVVVFMLVVGCAAFFFGILYLLGLLIGGVWRCMMRIVRPGPGEAAGTRASTMQVCPGEQCRKSEYRSDARFCSRCGTRLTGVVEDRKQ